ncbi:MAG: acetyl-CoA carboxylase, carboxyltransferase subunit beta [Firmicutes bacterium]|nr:acetyl-CoA carboxylase, carboxyltransferase subunit beta [Bacillota bacterium]
MPIGDLFKKNLKYIELSAKAGIDREKSVELELPSIPDNLFIKCPDCGEKLYTEEVKENLNTCKYCEHNFRIGNVDRLKLIADKDSFKEMDKNMTSVNTLDYPGYLEKIKGYQKSSGITEGVVTGTCTIEGIKVVIGIMDSNFMMGSMGSVVGEKVTRAIELATKEKLPLIIFTASGGARMQEGIISLMQMAKTSSAIKRFSDAGGLYISVITDPTTGGVTASFAMLGDIIIGEKGALIGFAGKRVIEQTIKQKLPDEFQTVEFLQDHGFIDKIVARKDMKNLLSRILILHQEVQDDN